VVNWPRPRSPVYHTDVDICVQHGGHESMRRAAAETCLTTFEFGVRIGVHWIFTKMLGVTNKLESLRLSCVVDCVVTCAAVFYRTSTCDRQTDRQTLVHSIYRAIIASRGES